MYQNVLDMVFFVTGGKTMRKPYASSSNYVMNMSDFKKGKWSEEVEKFWADVFLKFEKVIKSNDLNEIEKLYYILEFIYMNYYDTMLGDIAVNLSEHQVFSALF